MVFYQIMQTAHPKCTYIRFAAIMLFCLLPCWLGPAPYAAAELPRTGQRSCFDREGTVVDHAGTGQDGELQAGAVWPDPRFADNGDGTVTDRLTGLMWLQDGECLGQLTWQGAMDAASGAGATEQRGGCQGLAAYSDWMVPEIGQLEMLLNAEEASASGWLNKHRFKNVQAAGYWSRTTGPNPYRAWSFHFDSGTVRLTGKVDGNYCLLVRQPRSPEGESALPEAAPAVVDRFADNGDGTVTDRQSGLMWLKDGACLGSSAWPDALQALRDFNADPQQFACQGLRADYRDWSLPNRHELRSIIDHGYDLPALSPGYPFVDLHSRYWTSTTAAGRPAQAFHLLLSSGELEPDDKKAMLGVWPVRPATGRPDRHRIKDRELAAGVMKDPFLLEAIGGSRAIVWPVKRFTDHGDGTLTDNITGLMWLNDGVCFLPENWENAAKAIDVLNADPAKLKCARYNAAYHDWQLPDITLLRDLLGGAAGEEPAAWLHSQGATDVIARDYWVRNNNPLNLYFAWAVNLRQGTPRNYPMSFELHVWPVRLPESVAPVMASPAIRANGKEDKIQVKKGEGLLLSAAIANVSGAAPALFRIWYTAPDGKPRWLTREGEWVKEEADLYRGNLFVLEDTPVFRGDTTELETGDYPFSFAILPEAGSDGTAPQPFLAVLTVTVAEADAPPAPTLPARDEVVEEALTE
jgi:hypothetical protein